MLRILLCPTLLLLSVATGFAHDGPDPVAKWIFNSRHIQNENRLLRASLGPDGKIFGEFQVKEDPMGQSLHLSGDSAAILIAEDYRKQAKFLPVGPFTISAWFTVETPQPWGAVLGVIQDNGGAEKGLTLGYNEQNFYFGLASKGADDGDGKMTYLTGKTDYEPGRLYHVVAVYDGSKMELYVNGKLDGTSTAQSGAVLYPEKAPFVLGEYRDDDERHPHNGRIREISLYALAAKPTWVAKQFEQHAALTKIAPKYDQPLELTVPPYLQMATRNSMVVSWATSRPASTIVRFGENSNTKSEKIGEDNKLVHHLKLDSLKPNTQYFYKVESTVDDEKVQSEVFTFQTACDESTPFAFAVISDTQSNPKVAKQISDLAWGQRPSFLVHPGDLVGTGVRKTDWTRQFFPSMTPLISRVPMFPVLGNHEMNANNYYEYMMLPEPEYRYEFKYGNAHFFMVDSNKNVGPESDQYVWLDKALAASDAKWKFVVHHHPPFSSDENDYGNLWKTNVSTRGDMRVRKLTKLYDKHGVDIVFTGHVHSYERTWPLRGEKAVGAGEGTIYMVTGGGGGGLERAGPFRPYFQNNVRRGHHYCMVHINGGRLELKSFDLEGRLFDKMELNQSDSK